MYSCLYTSLYNRLLLFNVYINVLMFIYRVCIKLLLFNVYIKLMFIYSLYNTVVI